MCRDRPATDPAQQTKGQNDANGNPSADPFE
jgi:hypothetical protein